MGEGRSPAHQIVLICHTPDRISEARGLLHIDGTGADVARPTMLPWPTATAPLDDAPHRSGRTERPSLAYPIIAVSNTPLPRPLPPGLADVLTRSRWPTVLASGFEGRWMW